MKTEKYLRHRINKRIYAWHHYLAENTDFEEISREEAYPERFIPAKQKERKSRLKLDTEDIEEAPTQTNQDLGLEVSRKLLK